MDQCSSTDHSLSYNIFEKNSRRNRKNRRSSQTNSQNWIAQKIVISWISEIVQETRQNKGESWVIMARFQKWWRHLSRNGQKSSLVQWIMPDLKRQNISAKKRCLSSVQQSRTNSPDCWVGYVKSDSWWYQSASIISCSTSACSQSCWIVSVFIQWTESSQREGSWVRVESKGFLGVCKENDS